MGTAPEEQIHHEGDEFEDRPVPQSCFHPAAFLAWVIPIAGGLCACQAMGLVSPTYITFSVWIASSALYFALSRVLAPAAARA